MGRVRVYGYVQGESSFAQVTRGMRRVLETMGELAGVYPIDGEPESVDAEWQRGEEAPFSLNFGAPEGLLRAHRAGGHEEHWLLLAPNSESVPGAFVTAITQPSRILPKGLLSGGLLTPSEWGAKILRAAFPKKRVIVAPHGLTPGVHEVSPVARQATRKDFEQGLFNVLHMTSTETDRKGTRRLMAAWKQAKADKRLPRTARLHILMNPTHVNKVKWWASDLGLTESDYVVAPGLAYGQKAVAALYGSMHLVCQPSRAEGFGMVPLEALACGVPVAATICTGHTEYARHGLLGMVPIPHGPGAALDDFPGATAPEVAEPDIYTSLAIAYDVWTDLADKAEGNARRLAADWSWERKNVGPLGEMLSKGK
jgi:glycosyltransferase involved in cell wall biosynthesis